ncbi:MAG: hypothetical protein WBQ81_05050, partial [Candidatus Sulfotelmatobacter sp.]
SPPSCSAYKLRYPDDAVDKFNIALNQVRLLVELDRTVNRRLVCRGRSGRDLRRKSLKEGTEEG